MGLTNTLFITTQADTFIRPRGIRGVNGSLFTEVGQRFTHLRHLTAVSLSSVVILLLLNASFSPESLSSVSKVFLLLIILQFFHLLFVFANSAFL